MQCNIVNVLNQLFPSWQSFGIFVAYMSLFINQGILVTASQNKNSAYSYNTITVVLLTEVLKLIISFGLYVKDYSAVSFIRSIISGYRLLGLYFVPASLYCLYNNLAFVNLSTFDPTTYYLLLQLRVVLTGFLFQIIFRKKLSRTQWGSLVLLTFGCMLQQIKFNSSAATNTSSTMHPSFFALPTGLLLILVQVFCSSLAGVYNEHLLKTRQNAVNVYIQNSFLYIASIVCNIIVMLYMRGNSGALSSSNLQAALSQPIVVLLLLNNAAVGIVTSFFLRYLNSILKTFASSLELMFTAVLCYVLFGIPVYVNTMLAIVIVSFAVFVYAQSPVTNENARKLVRLGFISIFSFW